MRRALRVLRWFVVVVFLLVAVTAGWAWIQVGRSLAQRSGSHEVAGLSSPVTVNRDGLGVPTVSGASRLDVGRALGFIHAQDRFFQMDLSRRRAAGELSELFGRAALITDRNARMHRFRHRAAAVLAAASPDERALLDAYAAGVNAGLEALGTLPFEYLLLGKNAVPWTVEDSVLVVASMYFSLQDSTAEYEARGALVHEAFPPALANFLNSTSSEWETPMHGEAFAAPVPPPAEVFDLRSATGPPTMPRVPADVFAQSLGLEVSEEARGSNNWVIAGSRTADGRALLSDDMHLGLSVPNIWYRASLTWAGGEGSHQVTGVTLPGTPAVIVGSNGHIAWGFTNTTSDWSDRVLIDVVPGDPSRYLTPDGPRPFVVVRERIGVADEPDQWLDVRETIWGPVVEADHAGRLFAVAWVAHHPESMNFRMSKMEYVRTIDEAMNVLNLSGAPGQNGVIADSTGNIAWTIAGRIPRREGFTGEFPTSWADGSRRWNGWYDPFEYPRIVNPPEGIIVTANNRIVSDSYLAMLGDGGYDPGARARQIVNALKGDKPLTVADMLAVQLDDRAVLLERWRALALKVIPQDATGTRAEFRRLLLEAWNGRASSDSVGYRLARRFRIRTAELAFEPFVERLRVMDKTYPATPARSLEGPVWALVSAEPPHLLNPAYADWNALMLDAIDQTIVELTSDGRALKDRTWGEANTVTIAHPISRAIPQLWRWLDMPRVGMPGDNHMPRVQTTTNGASERLTVSPGNEAAGYFHMATGQSGNPRSPHYRDGHDAWVRGAPTPFMPGPTVATLELRPR